LHSLGKRNNKDLDSRIKDAPTIYETATVVLEVVPDFANKTSDFGIIKDRFGLAGFRVKCGFEKGRFVEYNDDFVNRVNSMKVDDLMEHVKPLSSKEEE
jgi:hypothetical protein